MNEETPTSRRRPRRVLRLLGVVFVLYLLPVGYQVAAYHADRDPDAAWWNARNDSSQQAPDPATTRDAIVQVYAARAVRWRGALGVHTWIATRRSGEAFYDRLEVMGYALRWGGSAVQVRRGQPDRYWYGNPPQLLREIRGGAEVDELIDRLHAAAASYPYRNHYRVWPGPNSNTFVAHLARAVPELNLELPTTAIGKDYLPDGALIDTPPSGRGLHLSLNGLLGLMVAPEEGVELNVLGLSAGLDLSPVALKLPAIGRIGFDDFERTAID